MMSTVTKHSLDQFTGSENMFMHWTRRMVYTDGCKFLCDNGAAWLIDAIASYQDEWVITKNENLKYFQLWLLEVSDGTAKLTCHEDSGEPAVISQEISLTDFPFSLKLYVERGFVAGKEIMVCMIPSER
jgi:hypothetical protein